MLNDIPVIKGIFAEEIINFIKYKRSLGHKYPSSMICICTSFNTLVNNNFNLDKIELPEELVYQFIKKKENESVKTQMHRISFIKQFALYLRINNYPNIYLLEDYPKLNNYNFIPYIYSEDEINRMNNAFNECKSKNKEQYKVIFKLLYSTGMRISEALNLKIENYDSKKGIIYIYHSKNNVSRIVFLSDTMNKCLTRYLDNNKKECNWLFPNRNNTKVNQTQYENFFKKVVLKNAKIEERKDGYNGPRIHDLRHTFSIHALEKLHKEGMEYYNILPILSKYLGHTDIRHTEYYLRLTKNNYEKVIINNDVIPEISYE